MGRKWGLEQTVGSIGFTGVLNGPVSSRYTV